jgi:hypothetical protein
MEPRTSYPDISDVLARKAAGRRKRAALSFAEKLDVLDKMKDAAAPFARARERRQGG